MPQRPQGCGRKKLFRRRKYVCSDTKEVEFVLRSLNIGSDNDCLGHKHFLLKVHQCWVRSNGIKLHAYLAKPASPKNNTPAVIIFHTWQVWLKLLLFCGQVSGRDTTLLPQIYFVALPANRPIFLRTFWWFYLPRSPIWPGCWSCLGIRNIHTKRWQKSNCKWAWVLFRWSQSLIFASRHSVAATVTCYGTYQNWMILDPKHGVNWRVAVQCWVYTARGYSP